MRDSRPGFTEIADGLLVGRDSSAGPRIRDMPGFEVFGPEEIASKLIDAAASKQYRDSPALAAVKLLETAGRLQGGRPPAGDDV